MMPWSERKWVSKECLEKCFYHGSGGLPRVALFGAEADMKHLGEGESVKPES